LSNFISKLNWRLMVVHFVACWFMYHALWQLGFLYDYKFLEILAKHNVSELIKHNNTKEIAAVFRDYRDQDIGRKISMDLFYAECTGLAGIVVAFIVSLLLSRKPGWFWVNSLIVFLVTFGAFCLDTFYWFHFRFILMFDGLFKSLWAYNLISGLLLLTVGICLFFSKRIIKFINGKDTQTIPGTSLTMK
jgi:hypothetical protein